MPSRVNVYCRRSVDHVDGASIRQAIDDADLYTMAEGLELPEGDEVAAVKAMKPHLRVDENLDVHWKAGGRPIQIEVTSGSEVQSYLEEVIEELESRDDADGPNAEMVLDHLRACSSIVHLEMSLDAPETLCGVLAEVIGYHFAEEGDGLVWFYSAAWASPTNWGSTLWNTE